MKVYSQYHGLLVHLGGIGAHDALLCKRGWSRAGLGNSLFEDAAEYGFGMAMAINQRRDKAELSTTAEHARHQDESGDPVDDGRAGG